ncbi:MAG: peptidylprolyl isomerase [Planctomycetia bacterium]|nr:peptidylprolyl isomerase [Planctomycetia bacterium]
MVGCTRSDPAAPSGTSAGGTAAAAVGGALRTEPAPVVVLHTSLGPIKLRLNTAKAPATVDNFLAQVDGGFYDQTIFHQVQPGYVVLGGGYRADLSEKRSRYSIANEAANGLKNLRATIAMTRPLDGVDSATGPFFINLGDNPQLDHRGATADDYGYCVFGDVIEGMDVVERIAQVPARASGDFPSLPVETVLIESATRAR